MTLWTTLKSLFGTKTIASPADLKAFLESRSAYLVQKSLTEYSQARANMMFSTLLGEKNFQQAYEKARWHSYPAGLSMVAEVLTGALRNRLNVSAENAAHLMQSLAKDILMSYPTPAEEDQTFWTNAVEKLNADLSRAMLGLPRPVHIIAEDRAREIFEALPFHSSIKQHDFEMFRNTLKFHLTEIGAELADVRLLPEAAKQP